MVNGDSAFISELNEIYYLGGGHHAWTGPGYHPTYQ